MQDGSSQVFDDDDDDWEDDGFDGDDDMPDDDGEWVFEIAEQAGGQYFDDEGELYYDDDDSEWEWCPDEDFPEVGSRISAMSEADMKKLVKSPDSC